MVNRGQLCTIRHRISPAGRPYKRKVFPLERFLYSDNEKRYHTYSYELRKKFGKKVAKVALNAGFSCPNRDGARGFGGCSYCSAQKSGDFAGNPQIPLRTQFEIQKNQTSGNGLIRIISLIFRREQTPMHRLKCFSNALKKRFLFPVLWD